ncbi:hypothetical protein XENOCAPTIV_007847 [Xenoophorus captivus]|uniref:Thyroglobulin type-1 domain-containing protein n=1 Tax=Xenoophorus captivus TaxID=1517983 RepID=A0ABV0RXI0_9TELE
MYLVKGESLELQPDLDVSEIPIVRKPSKDTTWLGPKESAVRQHRQEMKTKMKTNKVEEVRPTRPKQCQQELDQVLERISKMPFRDNRGPLEDLYALHIPNCDKRGQYNPKQVVQLLVRAHPPAMQERMERLLLTALGQAAESAHARPRVHAARLALLQRARQAAAAAGLLHQLAAHGHRWAHGQGLRVARLARNVRRPAAGDAQQRNR